MSLTKKDKEEIAKIVKQILVDAQTARKDNIVVDEMSKLEELDKKWREHGIKSETTGLIIAPEDVEIDGKTEFTWDEAMELEKEGKIPEGWRLPTRHEWALIAEEFGQDENGELRGDVLGPKLNLEKNSDGGYYGHYWSSTAYSSSTYAYNFNYSTSNTYPQNTSYKYFGFSVRCVAQ